MELKNLKPLATWVENTDLSTKLAVFTLLPQVVALYQLATPLLMNAKPVTYIYNVFISPYSRLKYCAR